jgi:hypothetical protein
MSAMEFFCQQEYLSIISKAPGICLLTHCVQVDGDCWQSIKIFICINHAARLFVSRFYLVGSRFRKTAYYMKRCTLYYVKKLIGLPTTLET